MIPRDRTAGRPSRRRSPPGRRFVVALVGIDGAGKTTAANVLANHLRARRFDGVVILDRHLYCQQALRAARGLPRGGFLAALTRMLPAPDAVVFLDVGPEEACRRIAARGTDSERVEDLRSYRDGYLGLREFAGFRHVDADGPMLGVLDELEEIVGGRGQQPTPAPPRPAVVGAGGWSGRSGPAVMPKNGMFQRKLCARTPG